MWYLSRVLREYGRWRQEKEGRGQTGWRRGREAGVHSVLPHEIVQAQAGEMEQNDCVRRK